MTLNEFVVCTPRYVLLDGDRRLGPKVIPLDLGVMCSVIYGFSDKGLYDRFCGNSDLALKPYPLVEGYLRNQVGGSGSKLKLVVFDAEGPRERCLHASSDGAQPVGAVPGGVQPGDVGEQYLRGADVRCRLLATNVLLAGLEREA